MREQPWMKWAALALSVILIVALIFVSGRIRKERQEEREQLQTVSDTYAEKMRPLWNEKRRIERELAALENEQVKEEALSVSVLLLCTEPDARIMDDMMKKTDNYGYPALVCVSPERFFGDEGCLTVAEMSELVGRGWEICVTVNGETDIPALYRRVLDAGLPTPVAVYYPNGGYDRQESELLLSMGINKAIVYGTDDYHFQSMWQSFAYGSMEKDSQTVFWNKIQAGESVVLTVGYTDGREMYNDSNLSGLLDSVDSLMSDGLLFVRNLSDAYLCYQEYLYSGGSASFESRRTDLQERLNEIEDELDSAAKKNGADDGE